MTNNLNNNPSLPLAGTKLSQRACNTGILKAYSCPFMKQASVENFFVAQRVGCHLFRHRSLRNFTNNPIKIIKSENKKIIGSN